MTRAAVAVDPAAIPSALKQLDRWVLWKLEQVGGRETKVPYQPLGNKKASANDPNTWSEYPQVESALLEADSDFDGVGIVLSGALLGFDLDDCFLRDGELKPWAEKIVELVGSYVEVSPSGTGLKIFTLPGTGDDSLPKGARSRVPMDESGGFLEVYGLNSNRYFTITGAQYRPDLQLSRIAKGTLVSIADMYLNGNGSRDAGSKPAREMEDSDAIYEGEGRDNWLTSQAGRMRYAALEPDEILLPLKRLNESYCRPPLPQSDVLRIASGMARYSTEHAEVAQFPSSVIIKRAPVVEGLDELPDVLTSIPGVLDQVRVMFEKSAISPDPVLAIATALALGSVAVGRKYHTDQNNFGVLYLLVIAETGVGKENIKNVIEQCLFDAELDHLVGGGGFTSGGAVFSQLLQQPSSISIIDEFGADIANARSKGMTYKASYLKVITEAWGRCHSLMRPETYSQMSGQKSPSSSERMVWFPSLTLVGMTNPVGFWDAATGDDLATGVINRWALMASSAERQPFSFSRRSLDSTPSGVVGWLREVRSDNELGALRIASLKPLQRQVRFSEAAKEVITDLSRQVLLDQEKLRVRGLDAVLSREVEMAMRIALICAISEDPKCTEISEANANWAREFTRHFVGRVMVDEISKNISSTEFERLEKRVLRQLNSKGQQRRRDILNNALSGVDPLVKKRVFESLIEAGKIVVAKEKENRNHTRSVWYAAVAGDA